MLNVSSPLLNKQTEKQGCTPYGSTFETLSNEKHTAPILPCGFDVSSVDKLVETVEHNNVAISGRKTIKKSVIWYVLYTYTTRESADVLAHREIHHAWVTVQSKFAAKIAARDLITKGCHIIDIVQGTKTHITHKYLGLDRE